MAGMQIVGVGRVLLSRLCCLVVCAIAVVGAFEGRARATCSVYNGVRECSEPNLAPTNGVIGVVGQDSQGIWVGWKDKTTGECVGWDQIGNANGFFNSLTIIYGTNYSDILAVVGGTGYEFCESSLATPNVGGVITLHGRYGGQDVLQADANFRVDMDCSNSDSCAIYLGGEENYWGGQGYIFGSEGNDFVVKQGQGSWHFDTGYGNDSIYNESSVIPSSADCGDGTDSFSGVWQGGGGLANCETIN